MPENKVLVIELSANAEALAMVSAVRQAGVYAEILTDGFARAAQSDAAGLILMGDGEGREDAVRACLSSGLPILCFGSACLPLVNLLGGETGETAIENQLKDLKFSPLGVFKDVEGGNRVISRASYLSLPEGARILSGVEGTVIAFDAREGRVTGMQFLPEQHDLDVTQILMNYLFELLKLQADYSPEKVMERQIARIKAVAANGEALCVLSGGVDSTVAACLAHRALGEKAHFLLVDTGLMRRNEPEHVQEFMRKIGIGNVVCCDKHAETLTALKGVRTAKDKRRAIDRVIHQAIREQLENKSADTLLVLGTNLNDVYSGKVPEPIQGQTRCMEPLYTLLKSEIRAIALLLQLPAEVAYRRHYPAAGIALRCVGEVDARRLEVLRSADAILQEQVASSAQLRKNAECFAVLTDVTDAYEGFDSRFVIVLRVVNTLEQNKAVAARLSFDVLESVADTILEKVPGVYRVVYDLSACPPAKIEWE